LKLLEFLAKVIILKSLMADNLKNVAVGHCFSMHQAQQLPDLLFIA
jgi:hypothetical protein